MAVQLPANHDVTPMWALRNDILESPVSVGLERAEVFTRVFQENEGAPWIVKKAMALRRYLRTVPLYVRRLDRIAGAISERPGAMPVHVEIGIAENPIYITENPHRRGYLKGQVPQDILDYWEDRNLWGRYRGYMRSVHGWPQERTEKAAYQFIANLGHLSPSYSELLGVGLGGILERVRRRRRGETDPDSLEFLAAAEHCLLGVIEWAERYAAFLAEQAENCDDVGRKKDLGEMSRIAAKVPRQAPSTFREAMQAIWFCHQAIHIEGHGYSCTPDRLDQLLHPFYAADKQAGRLNDDEGLTLCENFILKMRDNTVWGPEHNLTQGLVVGGSTPDGADQTNELSWLFITAADNMSLPEPLVWVRWHPNIDRDFFDHCLKTLAGRTCFPLMMSDTVVPEMFMEFGVVREDAFNYVPCGCNEISIPGQAYYHPCAHVDYLAALQLAMTGGEGYDGSRPADPETPPTSELRTFDDLAAAVGAHMRRQVGQSYRHGLQVLNAHMHWGQTPLTSCFFDGCIERARDLIQGTRYNTSCCGGAFFSNMVDCLAAIREVVYRTKEAALEEVVAACRADFKGHEKLRLKLLRAPKHGNDDECLDDLIALVERLRDEPVKDICRDPRDGSPFGNTHIVRSAAITQGRVTPATPDGRLAGTPLAASVAASCGAEMSGPTALLNSILKLNAVKSWQSGYNVNLRLSRSLLTRKANRDKVHAMLESYFLRGGQEMQINCVDAEALRAAQQRPEEFKDIVVRVAGFSEFFVRLDPDTQADIIARTEHG